MINKSDLPRICDTMVKGGTGLVYLSIALLIVNALTTAMLHAPLFPISVGIALIVAGLSILMGGKIIEAVFLQEPAAPHEPVKVAEKPQALGDGEYDFLIIVGRDVGGSK